MIDAPHMVAAVEAYIDGFNQRDPKAIANLYADNATVEDPVGSAPKKGKAEIEKFYAGAVSAGAKLKLEGPVRVTKEYAVFPFSVNMSIQGAGGRKIDVIDTFKFDEQGKVVEMRAFWGPTNMHGF